MALACDMRIATPSARFKFPETALGILPAAGGLDRLPALIGASRAKELVLFGCELDASTALEWGLVNELIATDELWNRVRGLAQVVAERDPLAIRLAKRLLDRPEAGRPDTTDVSVAQALLYQRNMGKTST